MSQGIDLTLPPELDRRKKPDLEAAREASRIHGRLLADVHSAGYNFERAMGEFKWLLAEAMEAGRLRDQDRIRQFHRLFPSPRLRRAAKGNSQAAHR